MPPRGHAVVTRTPGLISSGYFPLLKSLTLSTWGQDRARTTGGSYNRHSGSFYLSSLFIMTALLWDIRTAGTYKVAFVSDLTNAPTDLYVINAAFAAAGGGAEETITLPSPIFLLPGRYFLSILKTAAAGTMDDHNTPVSVIISDYLTFYDATYDGASGGIYTLPVKIVGYVPALQGISNFMVSPV